MNIIPKNSSDTDLISLFWQAKKNEIMALEALTAVELIQNKARRLSDMVQDLRNLIEKRQISIPPTVGESNTTAKDTAFSLSHQLNEIENACCKVISQTNNLHADYDCCMCQMNDVAGKLTALSASVKNDR